MRIDRILAAAFVVLVSTAIIGFSAGNTGASFTASTTNPNQSWATSNVAAPASETATTVAAGQINLSWQATTTPANGHTVTYLVFRGGVQIASTSSLSYSDTPPADGTYTYYVQTKIAQGAGFFTSGNSPSQSPLSDRTAPTVATALISAQGAAGNPVTVDLTWTAGTDAGSGVSGYTVYWSNVVTLATCPAISAANYPNSAVIGVVTSYSISTNVVSGSKYCAYLTTTDAVGNVSVASAVTGPTKAR